MKKEKVMSNKKQRYQIGLLSSIIVCLCSTVLLGQPGMNAVIPESDLVVENKLFINECHHLLIEKSLEEGFNCIDKYPDMEKLELYRFLSFDILNVTLQSEILVQLETLKKSMPDNKEIDFIIQFVKVNIINDSNKDRFIKEAKTIRDLEIILNKLLELGPMVADTESLKLICDQMIIVIQTQSPEINNLITAISMLPKIQQLETADKMNDVVDHITKSNKSLDRKERKIIKKELANIKPILEEKKNDKPDLPKVQEGGMPLTDHVPNS
ncbi:hypothetical protein DID74_02175 [Candidatus Marinamargulisbacteria bacterium SCGC AG-333-B06]|nr:hypothetical protein DID74_02175 [Candidatus Marinamargulisbacteria bacterium SCGC AG-333-B06]